MKTFLRALIAGLLLIPFSSFSEDVDLFVGTPPTASERPNVLIILDNTANWNLKFTNEMAALASVVNTLPVDTFNIGLMLFSETGNGNSNLDGGYLRAAIRPLTASNKTRYKALVESLDKLGDKGNNGKLSLSMLEAYRYISGGTVYAGNDKNKADYTGNISGTAASKAIYDLSGNALNSRNAATYNSPIVSGGCAKNFIIFIKFFI